MKNIYLSAPAGALYVNDYTENVLNTLDGENAFYFLSAPSDNSIYKKENIRFLLTGREAKKGLRSVTDGWRVSVKKECRKNRPDVFFVHNANPWVIVRYYPLWRKAKKRVLMFWGTDMNEISLRNERILRLLLPSVTLTGFTSETLRAVFLRRFGEKYADRSRVVMFGMPLFEELLRLRGAEDGSAMTTKADCRKKFGIPDGKICIHVGYNAPEAQQHIKLLESLGRLPDEIKEKIFVVIPFGYGRCKSSYKDEVAEAVRVFGIDGRILPDYLAKPDTAMLRNACDIFLYGRTVDSHSFTPAEYMYMGARVVMPRWLLPNYAEFDAVPEYEHYVYADFDELTGVMQECIENVISAKGGDPRRTDDLREWMRGCYSWAASAPKWKEML